MRATAWCRWPNTAVIMSTAQDDPHTVRTSRKLSALAYVIKPFDPAWGGALGARRRLPRSHLRP
jgi:DNA-binding response OmpR family regulator